MAKLMSYKSTGLGGASKSFKRAARKVDKFREATHKYRKKQVVAQKRAKARVEKKELKDQEKEMAKYRAIKGKALIGKTKTKPVYEAKQHKTYSASGARIEKIKLEKKGLNVKTVKTGSGIFTEYKAYTNKPLPKEKYWD